MSLYDDHRAEMAFAEQFPFGVPGETWKSKNGEMAVKAMTDSHIRNCMRIVGEDDPWYGYFLRELINRGAKENEK